MGATRRPYRAGGLQDLGEGELNWKRLQSWWGWRRGRRSHDRL